MSLGKYRIGSPVLIPILVLSIYCRGTESLIDSASIGSPDGIFTQQREWLLQELNGAHLRLSASVVGYNIRSEKTISSQSYSLAGSALVNTKSEFKWNGMTYHGNIVEFADYVAQAFNAT